MPVTRLELRSRSPYAEGVSFGDVGPYERLRGTIHFAVDPQHAANRAVVDLDKAPRDNRGRVHFRADFGLLQPVEPARANRSLLFHVVNRGRQVVPFNRVPADPEPTDRLHPGDGFLMRRGWTVAWCGWQWDVIDDPVLVGLDAPEALGPDGLPIQGEVVSLFQPHEPTTYQHLSHYAQTPAPGRSRFFQHEPYPAADVDDPDARLTVRDWPDGPRSHIPRARWRFARQTDAGPVADDRYVWLEEGFQPGRIYEVTYRTRICPVVGSGFLAVRDCTSFLRHAAAADGNPSAGRLDYAFAYGQSQCGRFLRHYLSDGMNVDEAGRQVFDGLIPHVAGARRGEFNHRYAQPSVQHVVSFGHLPPFHDDDQDDLLDGHVPGLLSRQRAAGGVPKVFTTNTSSEYWRVEASLTHTDPSGRRDAEPPAEVRNYLFAGTQHGPGVVPPPETQTSGARGVYPYNTVDYLPLLRAALVNLHRWVVEGVAPPASAFPRLADGTAVPRERVLDRFRELGAGGRSSPLPEPAHLPRLRRIDLDPDAPHGVGRFPAAAGEPYPSYVAAVDEDGNEQAGIRLPDLTVPLASHTGWNPRHPETGAPEQILDMLGSSIPLAPTAAARRQGGDARRSIEERYRDRDDYLERVRVAAERLAAERYLLEEDVEVVVALAGERYDYFSS